MFEDDNAFDQLIGIHRRAMRYYICWAIGLVVLGLGVMIGGSTASRLLASGPLRTETFKNLFALGGSFVTSLSALQIKEILIRIDKISVLRLVQIRRRSLARAHHGLKKAERERIDAMLWQVIEKTATS